MPPDPTPPAPPVPAPPPLPMPTAGSMFRQFVQLLVLIVSLLLVVRTVFLEPFGVPTGSMAPALLGNHREAACPNCDHPVKVGAPSEGRANPQERAYCPNCGHGPFDLTGLSREILGDRLLVDKSIFTLRPPHRWEVAVFYTPDQTVTRTTRPRPFALRAVGSPGEPFVKRIVGLPGEAIHIRDGDVYANGVLCRKTLSQVWETAVLVVNTAFVPAGSGWLPRWAVETPGTGPTGTASVEGAELTLDAAATSATAVRLAYRHRDLTTKKDEPVSDRLGYNGDGKAGRPVHDFAIRCEVEATAGAGTFACRLFDGADAVVVELPVGGEGPAEVAHEAGRRQSVPGVRLVPGRKHRLEFAFVDRRATALLDGAAVGLPLDLPPPPADRPRVERPLRFEARGATVAVRDVALFRDIHYFADAGQQHAGAVPFALAADEFFALGDNANDSWDSRSWRDATGAAKPGVPRGAFIGKPFFIHQPLRAGRVTVNGTDRQFTTVDWDRVRLLE